MFLKDISRIENLLSDEFYVSSVDREQIQISLRYLEQFGIHPNLLSELEYSPEQAIGQVYESKGEDLILPVRNIPGWVRAVSPEDPNVNKICLTFGDPNGLIGWLAPPFWPRRYYNPSGSSMLFRAGYLACGHPDNSQRRPFKAYPTDYGWYIEVESEKGGIYDTKFVYEQM